MNRKAAGDSAWPPDRSSEMVRLGAAMTALQRDVEWLRVRADVEGATLRAIERRLTRLDETLGSSRSKQAPSGPSISNGDCSGDGAESRVTPPKTPLSMLLEFEQAHGDTLLVLDTAFISAAETRYDDMERLRAVLRALTCVARRRLDGVLRVSVASAVSEFGIECLLADLDTYSLKDPSPSGRRRKDRPFHCLLVDASDDPLRIHFSSDSSTDSRFTIVYVGRSTSPWVIQMLDGRVSDR